MSEKEGRLKQQVARAEESECTAAPPSYDERLNLATFGNLNARDGDRVTLSPSGSGNGISNFIRWVYDLNFFRHFGAAENQKSLLKWSNIPPKFSQSH